MPAKRKRRGVVVQERHIGPERPQITRPLVCSHGDGERVGRIGISRLQQGRGAVGPQGYGLWSRPGRKPSSGSAIWLGPSAARLTPTCDPTSFRLNRLIRPISS